MSCSVGKYKFTVCHLESALTFYNSALNKTQNARQGLAMLRFRLSGPRPKDILPKGKVVSFSKYKYVADLHLRKLWTCLRHCQQKKMFKREALT